LPAAKVNFADTWGTVAALIDARLDTGRSMNSLVRNTVRGLLGIVLAAAATWLANFIVDQVFGPEEEYE